MGQIGQRAVVVMSTMLLGFCDSRVYQVRAASGRRIGMCGYTSVPKTDVLVMLFFIKCLLFTKGAL